MSSGSASSCPREIWCCTQQPTLGTPALPFPLVATPLRAHQLLAQTAKMNQKAARLPERLSPRAPGGLQTQAARPVPSPDTAPIQRKHGRFQLPRPEHAVSRPSVSAHTSLGRAFKGARASQSPLWAGASFPSPWCTWCEGLEDRSGEGDPPPAAAT